MIKKLTRNTNDKMVAGVASGLAQYFQLDVTWVRIAFALAAFFGGGGLWIYIILWIAVPEEAYNPFQYTDYRVNSDDPLNTNTFANTNTFSSFNKQKNKSNLNLIGGLVLIGLGTYFLLREFDMIPYWVSIKKLWPLIFVGIGLSILLKAKKEANTKNSIDTAEFDKKPEEVKPEEVNIEAVKSDEANKNTNL
jgi:phage shock protein C